MATSQEVIDQGFFLSSPRWLYYGNNIWGKTVGNYRLYAIWKETQSPEFQWMLYLGNRLVDSSRTSPIDLLDTMKQVENRLAEIHITN